MKKVSIIIPVKNGEGTLVECLMSIQLQTIFQDVELIIIDSGSTDKSISIAKSFGAKIITIDPLTFNHGLTRNLGVAHATASILYFTVQDARIAEKDMLQKMLAHFNDIGVMGVSGHQAIPKEKDKNPALWFQRVTKPIPIDKKSFLPTDFNALSPKEQWKYCAWDNVVAMYRKTALEQLPFDDTMHTEDWIWARKALINNFKLVYDSSLVVYHYHHRYFKFTFSNEFIVSSSFYYFFDKKLPVTNTGFKKIGTYCYRIWKNNSLKRSERLYWTYHNLASELAVICSVVAFRIFALFGKKSVSFGTQLFCKHVPMGTQKVIS